MVRAVGCSGGIRGMKSIKYIQIEPNTSKIDPSPCPTGDV